MLVLKGGAANGFIQSGVEDIKKYYQILNFPQLINLAHVLMIFLLKIMMIKKCL